MKSKEQKPKTLPIMSAYRVHVFLVLSLSAADSLTLVPYDTKGRLGHVRRECLLTYTVLALFRKLVLFFLRVNIFADDDEVNISSLYTYIRI